jgi:hypothetical protein
MELELLTQVGVGGLFAYVIIKEVLSFLSKHREPKVTPVLTKASWDKTSYQLQRLYDWHNIMDQDGVPVWYVRQSLEDAIGKLSTNLENQNKILERQTTILEKLVDRVEAK